MIGEDNMGMTEKIKILLIKRKMTVKELSEKLGYTSQNLSGKFKRDNFSENELIEIAKILDCTFDARFIMNDTNEII